VAGRTARGARHVRSAQRSQHFLRSPRLAAAIVEGARIGAGDLVVEIGAGSGRLTAPLADCEARVLAIELDPIWAGRLRERFGGRANVTVVQDDALRVPLPGEPFRVVANIPFHLTTALLRRLLDDPGLPLARADLIVEWDVACKRARCWPSTMLNVVWGSRFELAAVRRLPARCFEPRPDVDGGLLRIVPRMRPLVAARDQRQFRRLVEAGFRGTSLRTALHQVLPPRRFKTLARELGFEAGAAARDLDLDQWVALFGAVRTLR
jgi:16S rRNA A1518/A1519 N6-dimethyltransferase RsmA/KsgA/DIM1 with predicted DNA glycosylase/AP lyase activity